MERHQSDDFYAIIQGENSPKAQAKRIMASLADDGPRRNNISLSEPLSTVELETLAQYEPDPTANLRNKDFSSRREPRSVPIGLLASERQYMRNKGKMLASETNYDNIVKSIMDSDWTNDIDLTTSRYDDSLLNDSGPDYLTDPLYSSILCNIWHDDFNDIGSSPLDSIHASSPDLINDPIYSALDCNIYHQD